MAKLEPIHEEIIKLLQSKGACYARPATSAEIGDALNVSPSYVRQRISQLCAWRLVGVRRGPGGGYYVRGRDARWSLS